MFNTRQLIFHSLAFHWRSNLAVALGVAAATAVLTGALIIGDSVRGSLRQLTLDRLGHIDEALITDRFFRQQLADDVAGHPQFYEAFESAQPAILIAAATAETVDVDPAARAGDVFLVGGQDAFWNLDAAGVFPAKLPAANEVVVNETLAADLGVQRGDLVTLRLPDASAVPADSTLAQKTNRVRSLPRLQVVDVIPSRGLGRFSLHPHQGQPRNAYVALSTLQDVLEEPQKANAILVAAKEDRPLDAELLLDRHRQLMGWLQPTLSDFGLRLDQHVREFRESENAAPTVVYDYFSLTSDRMILEPPISTAARDALELLNGQEVLTYLADSIRLADSAAAAAVEIPYSTITGIDSSPHFPLLPDGQSLAADEIVLVDWAANRLQAQIGDRIVVEFFQPETVHGSHQMSQAELTLRHIVPLTQPASPYQRTRAAVFDALPTLFNDVDLTPTVKGITDQDTIANWEAPFPFDIRRMNDPDDDYWKFHRTTPKAYVSLATAQRLWGSRFGQATSFRVPNSAATSLEKIEQALLVQLHERETMEALGFQFIAVKRDGLTASRGTTSFDSLFLGLSFFIILSAVMLVAILFRLGVEQRGPQLGILTAVGLRQTRAVGLLVAEGAFVSGLGGVLGMAIALGYAQVMIAALTSEDWWLGAISTPFLQLHYTWTSLSVGYAIGVLVSLAAIYWTCRRLRRISARRLLAGQTESVSHLAQRRSRRLWIVAGVLILAAVGTGAAALSMSGMAQAGAFVGGGALTLGALLVLGADRLRSAASIGQVSSLWRLAASSAARHPARSTLTIGLMSSATFLIVSMSAFRLSPTLEGAGGFPLQARSSVPIFQNLNDATVRRDLLGQDAQQIADLQVFSFRVKPGNDASCRNLYRVTQPQVMAVPRDLAEYYDGPQRVSFQWAAHIAQTEPHEQNPWHLLWNSSANGAVPAVLDQNTATYSLGWKLGETYTIDYEDGTELQIKVVGLLSNSILQGVVLIGDERFRTAFPGISGYRFFLLSGEQPVVSRARELLENALSDQGFYGVDTRGVLDGLLAVQNTYLSTFQSLGALGLLLGTFGLASVQARSVLERRGELALLRAAGFRRRRVGLLVVLENFALLAIGLTTGVIAALCAVLPHIVFGGASVPVLGVLQLLAVVLVIGSLSGALAVQLALRGPLLSALRSE